ncbi:hypothetical protein LCGC14_3038690 [marine sediment metagenome]|uniref:Uncharacterized protein n=1 Tax=marine sediment metagenome TaxID=412755 RepID=A0A0F8WQT7_9ZZZZ
MNPCQKCHSINSVYRDEDHYGPYLTCWCCGWSLELSPATRAPFEPFAIKRNVVSEYRKPHTVET